MFYFRENLHSNSFLHAEYYGAIIIWIWAIWSVRFSVLQIADFKDLYEHSFLQIFTKIGKVLQFCMLKNIEPPKLGYKHSDRRATAYFEDKELLTQFSSDFYGFSGNGRYKMFHRRNLFSCLVYHCISLSTSDVVPSPPPFPLLLTNESVFGSEPFVMSILKFSTPLTFQNWNKTGKGSTLRLSHIVKLFDFRDD